VLRDGVEIRLTPKEFELLSLLARNHDRVLTHRAILKAIWAPNAVEQPEHLWTLVAQLRRKIESDPADPKLLLSEPWVGYRFASGRSWSNTRANFNTDRANFRLNQHLQQLFRDFSARLWVAIPMLSFMDGTTSSVVSVQRDLTVNVIATTYEGTRAALQRARRLVFGMSARIVVLVPITDTEATDPFLQRGRHPRIVETRALLAGMNLRAQVLACVCRRPADLAPAMLSPVSPVVVGGPDGKFWPSGEQWLAWRLMWGGYPVVFVAEATESVRERVSVSGAERGGWFHRLSARLHR
jgi:DNA-binding winged helix-turn-helix (wHTH) protein